MKGSSISASTPSSEEKVDLRSSFFFCLIWPKCREDKKNHCKNKKQGSCEEMKDKLWNIWQADTGRFRVNRVSFYGSAPTLRRTRGMMWNTFKGARGPTHLVSIYPVTGRHALWPLYTPTKRIPRVRWHGRALMASRARAGPHSQTEQLLWRCPRPTHQPPPHLLPVAAPAASILQTPCFFFSGCVTFGGSRLITSAVRRLEN